MSDSLLPPSIVRIVPPAGSSMKALFEMVEAGARFHLEDPQARILVDLRQLRLDPVAHALLGHHAGQNFRRMPGVRIAVLVPQATGQGQVIARQQGADLCVFSGDEEAFALEWLARS